MTSHYRSDDVQMSKVFRDRRQKGCTMYKESKQQRSHLHIALGKEGSCTKHSMSLCM